MIFLWTCLILILAVYAIMLLVFLYGWLSIPSYNSRSALPQIFVSVIVPVRNEEKNISVLLDCLVRQDYPASFFEILIMDDHSTDTTAAVVQPFQQQYTNIQFHMAEPGTGGKKAAIDRGVRSAKGDLIITTDADCRMNPSWLSVIVSCYQETNCDMIIGMVDIKKDSLWGLAQGMEFLSLTASGAGAAGAHIPFICNGANLAYRKDSYLKIDDPLFQKTSSGDDIFLLHHFIRQHKVIRFLKSPDAVVYTRPDGGLKAFLKQRVRWVSKSKYYKNNTILAVSIIVFFANLSLITAGFLSLAFPAYFHLFLMFLLLKALPDFLFLYPFINYYKRYSLLLFFIPVQIIYPFYAILMAFAGMLSKTSWKGRIIR